MSEPPKGEELETRVQRVSHWHYEFDIAKRTVAENAKLREANAKLKAEKTGWVKGRTGLQVTIDTVEEENAKLQESLDRFVEQSDDRKLLHVKTMELEVENVKLREDVVVLKGWLRKCGLELEDLGVPVCECGLPKEPAAEPAGSTWWSCGVCKYVNTNERGTCLRCKVARPDEPPPFHA